MYKLYKMYKMYKTYKTYKTYKSWSLTGGRQGLNLKDEVRLGVAPQYTYTHGACRERGERFAERRVFSVTSQVNEQVDASRTSRRVCRDTKRLNPSEGERLEQREELARLSFDQRQRPVMTA